MLIFAAPRHSWLRKALAECVATRGRTTLSPPPHKPPEVDVFAEYVAKVARATEGVPLDISPTFLSRQL